MTRNHRGSGGGVGQVAGLDAAFYMRHLPHVRARLLRMGIFGADMDDLVQQTFVIAHENWDQRPRERRKQRNWLEGIAWRLAMNLRRSEERHDEPLELESPDTFVAEELDPETRIDAQRLFWAVNDIVAIDGDMLRQYYLDDVPLTEVADQYGIARSTAWSRIQKLREALLARAGGRA